MAICENLCKSRGCTLITEVKICAFCAICGCFKKMFDFQYITMGVVKAIRLHCKVIAFTT